MATLKLDDYEIELDNMGRSVYYNYIGKTKDGEAVPKRKLIGHYGKSYKYIPTMISAIKEHGVSQLGELELEAFMSFMELQEENVIKWIEEQWEDE